MENFRKWLRIKLLNMSELGIWLDDALDTPTRWAFTEHRMTDQVTGTVFWIKNGGSFFNGYAGTPESIGRLERHYLYRKARKVEERVFVLRAKEEEGKGDY